MLAKICSGTIIGVDANVINVEVDVNHGLPVFDIVGLPDSAVKESKERVRTAINNSNLAFPIKRITINLAPANIKKEGPGFDLPIAVGILVCMNIVKAESVKNIFFSGELSLDGSVCNVKGILSMVHMAEKNGFKKCVIPASNLNEANLIKSIEVVGVSTLAELIKYLSQNIKPTLIDVKENATNESQYTGLDFADVSGQENVKHAIVIAASGNHNVIMIGPPGSGKTMMAKRIPSILPNLTYEESIEVTKIYSVANLLTTNDGLISQRPFRAPHHTISYAALIGGGIKPHPGEISLAHNGVLFLDELPEFYRNALEVLRQPLEDNMINIARTQGNITYPANFMLVASMNPCPCGYYGSSNKCKCTDAEISRYMNKISGPLLDRIDIQIEACAINYEDFSKHRKNLSSKEMKENVDIAVARQKFRYKNENLSFNADLTAKHMEIYCKISKDGDELLKQVFDSLGLSARAYHKILKLARTIADINDSDNIQIEHLAEAVQYRNLDRKYWS